MTGATCVSPPASAASKAARSADSEFAQHSIPVKIGDAPGKTQSHVSGVGLMEAIARLACVWLPRPIAEVRASVMQSASEALVWNVIDRAIVNRRGNIVGRRGSLLDGPEEDREAAVRHEMFERARSQREHLVVSAIEPARQQIAAEHYCGHRTLVPLTEASPFVPPGREGVFARGLAAGLNGDFPVALHLLIPQFEHGVRSLLSRSGTITSKIDAEGIQDEKDLGWLLYCADAERVFGPNLLFEMQGLLVERFGGNLRNEVAHGLLDADLMTAGQSVYFWWLTLHMVVWPLLGQGRETDEEELTPPPAGDGDA